MQAQLQLLVQALLPCQVRRLGSTGEDQPQQQEQQRQVQRGLTLLQAGALEPRCQPSRLRCVLVPAQMPRLRLLAPWLALQRQRRLSWGCRSGRKPKLQRQMQQVQVQMQLCRRLARGLLPQARLLQSQRLVQLLLPLAAPSLKLQARA